MDDLESHERNDRGGPNSGIRINNDGAHIDSAVEPESGTTRLFKRREIPSQMKHDSNDPRIGPIVDGRYRVVKRLAVGSTGVVYLAQQIGLDRSVAIKFLELYAAKQKTFLKLFEREARAMGQLSHPNCISVTDYGVADVPYIVMDLVNGHTLKQLTDRGPVEPYRAIQIVAQLLAALAHAHKRGIIHRDIKPGNIMLSEITGTGDFVRVFDFGMAKLLDVEHSEVDDPDMVLGTPHYMSPEHIKNQELDARSDLFSVGIVLYEALTGHKPFLVNDPTDILQMHDNVPLSINHGIVPGSFSAQLEAVVTRSLAVDITKRFQNAIEFRDALLSVPEARAATLASLSHPVTSDEEIAPVDSSNRPAKRSPSKGRMILWASIAVLSGLLALDIYLWMAIRPNMPEGIQVSRIDDLSQTTPLEAMTAHVPDRPAQAIEPPAQPDKSKAIVASAVSAPAKPDKPIEPKQSPEVATGKERPLDRSRPMALKVILAQIKAGNRDGAIADLIVLKEQRPDNAYLYLLLGNLYSEKRQWSLAIESYQSAVEKDPSYSSHKLLVGNTVLAIKDDLAYPAAKELIEKKIGPTAIPKLLPLVQRRAIPRLQERAQALIDQLSSTQQ